MADATAEFFDELVGAGTSRCSRRRRARVRFDLGNGKRRPIAGSSSIVKGDRRRVARERSRPTASSRPTRRLFDGVASGEANAMAALLRGALEVEGDSELLVLFQRLFPGRRAHERRTAAREEER